MKAFLEKLLLAALAFAVFGCNNYESKKAHAALQSVEFKFRDIDLAHPQIAEQSGYRILCIRGKTSNVFMLLNPRSIPYYSQLPEREHFTLTEAEFSAIVKQHIASRTVLNVLATKIQ